MVYQNKLLDLEISFIQNLKIAWNIFKTNFKLFFVLSIIRPLMALISVLLDSLPQLMFSDWIDNIFFILYFVTAFIELTLILIPYIVTEQTVLNNQSQLKLAFKKALSKTLIIIIITLILTIITGISFLLLIIPGIYLSTLFSFLWQSICLRNCKLNAFTYSRSLVKGRWWKVFYHFLKIGSFGIILSLFIFMISGIISFALPQILTWNYWVSFIFIILPLTYFLLALSVNYFITVITIYFLNLDYRKNGLPLRA